MAEPGPSEYTPALLDGLALDESMLGDGPWRTSLACNNWQEDQWLAKFRDVPFAVHSDDRVGGRRIHTHEFPDKETWANEDLGRRKQQVSVEAYVFGDRSDDWAELLWAACTTDADGGVGELFLPMRVPMNARCELVTSSWVEDALGRLTFSMRFVLEPMDAKSRIVPSLVKSKSPTHLSGAVQRAANDLIDLSRDTFERNFTGNHAHSGRKQAASMIYGVGTLLRNAYRQARTKLINTAKIDFNVRRMQNQAVELSDSQRTEADRLSGNVLVRTQRVGRASHQAAVASGITVPPNPLSGYAMRASTNQVINAIGKADEGFGGYYLHSLKLIAEGATNPMDLTQSLIPLTNINTAYLRAQMQTSSAASTLAELDLSETVAVFARRAALAHQCLATIRVAPDRQPDAAQIRTRILDTIDREMAAAADNNDIWEAFRDLRATVTDYVAYWSKDGPSTKKIVGRTTRALAQIAADNYPINKVSDRDRQIMRLNGVRHPLHAQAELSALRE